MHSIRRSVLLLALLALCPVVFAATFVVPPDRDLVRRADAIVVGTALSSFTQINDAGGIETVTSVQVQEVLKGQGLGETLTIVEPGGEHAGSVQFIPGVPRFNTSERSLFFLSRTGSDRWAVSELALGKFTFRQGRLVERGTVPGRSMRPSPCRSEAARRAAAARRRHWRDPSSYASR